MEKNIFHSAPRVQLGGVEVVDLRPGLGRRPSCQTHTWVWEYAPWYAFGGPPAPTAETCSSGTCWADVPSEVAEAAGREGLPFLSRPRPGPDGRVRVVLQGAPAEAIAAFLRGDGPAEGLVDRVGDPARGEAAGYLP